MQGEWFDVSVEEAVAAIENAIRQIDDAQESYRPRPALDDLDTNLGPAISLRLPLAMVNAIEEIRASRADNPTFCRVVRELLRDGLDILERRKRK
jgi:hypothetical protein